MKLSQSSLSVLANLVFLLVPSNQPYSVPSIQLYSVLCTDILESWNKQYRKAYYPSVPSFLLSILSLNINKILLLLGFKPPT